MATFGGLLKQSTATNVLLGPCLDNTDQFTPEGLITFAWGDVDLYKEGASSFVSKVDDTTNPAHKGGGYYSIVLSASDTNTTGSLLVKLSDPMVPKRTTLLGIDRTFQVIHATTWNALYSSSPSGFDVNADVTVGTIFGTALTQLQTASNDAMVALHLDHLLAADYDPASKPGNATSLLNELIESDSGVSRFTANALEAVKAVIADQVWTEAIGDHSGTSGSTAERLENITAILSRLSNLKGSGPTGRPR